MQLTAVYPIIVKAASEDGGEIVITTPRPDRVKDRILPRGGRFDNYMRNPIVQWGHNYGDPWATIGRSLELGIADTGITARFDLRPAANDQDPQSVIRLLWGGGWVKTASVGIWADREAVEPNELGGMDFGAWDLLEWSLVPIPMNPDAVRVDGKGLARETVEMVLRAGRVISRSNEERLRRAVDSLRTAATEIEDVLAQVTEESGSKAADQPPPVDYSPLANALAGLNSLLRRTA